MTLQHLIRYTQLCSHSSYFVLEQKAQWLYQSQVHFLGEASYIMMGFDGDGGAMYRDTFDDIRVDGALAQQPDTLYFGGFLLEYIDKEPANGLTFGFRICFTLQLA